VSIVGWSLGGIYARRLAQQTPRQVRQVISLGSPFSSGGRRRPARPLPVPSTAVYSRSDGVVDWRACRQRPGSTSENVAVRSSHLGMGHDPGVLWLVADRLAQTREGWRPFQRPTGFGLGTLFADDRS
jgi:pimeloyl-ACP methyl ester carboxylesterase